MPGPEQNNTARRPERYLAFADATTRTVDVMLINHETSHHWNHQTMGMGTVTSHHKLQPPFGASFISQQDPITRIETGLYHLPSSHNWS